MDVTFSNSLQEPADATPEANLNRWFQQAIREESRLLRQWSLEHSRCECSVCGCLGLSAFAMPLGSSIVSVLLTVGVPANNCTADSVSDRVPYEGRVSFRASA